MDMPRDVWTRLKSRKFLMALANIIFVLLNEFSGAPVCREAYWAVSGGIIAFILSEGYVDGKHAGEHPHDHQVDGGNRG